MTDPQHFTHPPSPGHECEFRVFALMMYDSGCVAPDTCTQDQPCGPCAAADALGQPRWKWEQ